MAINYKQKYPNALTRFVQIREFIVREIVAGRLLDGERLAPERQMTKSLDVSVGTLQKSLQELQKIRTS